MRHLFRLLGYPMLFLAISTGTIAQNVPPLTVDLFSTYEHPEELFKLFGKHWESDPIDVEFDLKGVDGHYLGPTADWIMMTGGNEGKHKAWKIDIKGLRHIGNLKFAGYIPTFWEFGDGSYVDDGGSAGRGGSNKYFSRNQFAIKTGMEDVRLIYGTPAETYGPIGPDNYDILIDWGGFLYSGPALERKEDGNYSSIEIPEPTLVSYGYAVNRSIDYMMRDSDSGPGYFGRQPSLTLTLACNGVWPLPNIPEGVHATLFRKPTTDMAYKSTITKPASNWLFAHESNLRLEPWDSLTAGGLNTGLLILNKLAEYGSFEIKWPPIPATSPVSTPTWKFRLNKVIFEKVGQNWYGGGGGIWFVPGGPSSVWPLGKEGKGFEVEVSMRFDEPFGFNRVAIGLKNMAVPIAMAPGLFWQDVKGGFYNIQAYPWNFKAETLFSVGMDKYPLVGYPASFFANVDIGANGYVFVKGGVKVFGVEGSTADFTGDPSQKFVRFRWKDIPLPPPFPFLSGELSNTAGHGSGHGSARIGIPSNVPVIGGLGLDVGEWQYDHRPKVPTTRSATKGMMPRGLSVGDHEFKATVGLPIAKFVPRLCSPVKVTFNTSKKFAWWDSCCSRAPWWLGSGCIGCPKFEFRNVVNIEWKEVCTDPIPAKFGQFRVGLKIKTDQPVKAYFDPLAAYDPTKDFYSQMYLADYPEWEIPFYYQHVDEMGRIAYYNYNWDRIQKEYSLNNDQTNPFQPLEQLDGNSSLHSVLIDEEYAYVVFRLNTENPINTVSDIELILPDGTELAAVANNLPFGYTETETIIVSKANSEAQEVFFKAIKPVKGEYQLHVHNRKELGNYTFEVLNQNMQPVIEYGEAEMAANRDATISKSQIDVVFEASDSDTDPEDVLIGVYLDKNKNGFNGIKIEETNLASITQGEAFRIETNDKDVPAGYYYAYITVDDRRNLVNEFYLDGPRLLVQDDFAPEPVGSIQVASTASGFDVSFEASPDHKEGFSYDIHVTPEFDPDNGGLTKTSYSDYNASFDNLNVGEPYLVSVISVNENGIKSYPKFFKRVVPGLDGKRPLHVLSSKYHDSTVGYNLNHRIKYVDGDILENSRVSKDTSLMFEIIGDSKGATIDNFGMFRWLPDVNQIGHHKFQIQITRLLVSGPDDTDLIVREAYPTIFEFSVNVLPADNLNGLAKNSVDILSTPNFRVLEGELYKYPLTILNSQNEDNPLTVEILEGPDGMEYVEETQTISWQTTKGQIGTFVEVALADEDFNFLVKQRWFIDVKSQSTTLNDRLKIVGVDISNSNPEVLDYVIHWNAPVGKYVIEGASDLQSSDWEQLGDKEEPGGFQSISGLRFDKNDLSNNTDQLFIRIRSIID